MHIRPSRRNPLNQRVVNIYIWSQAWPLSLMMSFKRSATWIGTWRKAVLSVFESQCQFHFYSGVSILLFLFFSGVKNKVPTLLVKRCNFPGNSGHSIEKVGFSRFQLPVISVTIQSTRVQSTDCTVYSIQGTVFDIIFCIYRTHINCIRVQCRISNVPQCAECLFICTVNGFSANFTRSCEFKLNIF